MVPRMSATVIVRPLLCAVLDAPMPTTGAAEEVTGTESIGRNDCAALDGLLDNVAQRNGFEVRHAFGNGTIAAAFWVILKQKKTPAVTPGF
jgi:hypothetical protein